jgi:hypothetical protein
MPNSNDVASNEMLWERVLSLLVVGASVLGGSTVYRRYHHYFTDFHRGPKRVLTCDHGARNRHSDNEKFCNDLNGQKNTENVRMTFENTTRFPDFQAEHTPAVISNGYHQRMSVSVVASPGFEPVAPFDVLGHDLVR